MAENLVNNPSFETNTTGWVTGGANSIARSTEQARFGAASLKATYQNNTALAQFAITLTAAAHSYSAYIYIPSNYDGTQIRLTWVGFGGATGTLNANANMAIRDRWQRVVAPNVTPAGDDLSGAVNVNDSAAPTAGRFIYIDGVQVELGVAATPFADVGLGAARAEFAVGG